MKCQHITSKNLDAKYPSPKKKMKKERKEKNDFEPFFH